ncbi:DNA primase [uncultured Phascolarctobacterium sp.]|uniref:DNA primase n=1 Tax=uncultured Phascolarctobacterium sp. TaxID=512296 RepID=UPI00261A4F10|nr:DNA primase [uncultured Phascolarctobacterium sp.]
MEGEFESFKEQVRGSADIVEVISGYVPLKKRGQNFWGCCPFHGEKTPSFAVNPAKNMFYCFGCHEGGDIFKFIMKIENCTFIDAMKLLAGRYGIPVPERQKSALEMKREKQRERIFEINATAAKFFQACLLNTQYGKPALSYLLGRGVDQKIIDSFSIGYALDSFGALLTNLGRRGYQPNELLAAGLTAKGKTQFYDKFRNRVMIPIKDPKGRIVGFGGRVLDSSTPKYLNTAETEWFNKRRILFAMDVALKAIRTSRQAIVVEGYMDAISLHASGIENVVASMGTAFAQEQAKVLKRAADEVVFCYDSDSAGRRASVRAASIAREAGLKVRIAGVPEGKDPDEYVRIHGKNAFLQVIAVAQNGIDFQIEETILQNDVTNLAGKVDAVSNILPFLLECKSEIEAAEHIRRLAQRLTIDEGLIVEEYRKAARKNRAGSESGYVPITPVKAANVGCQAEQQLLAVLLEYPWLTVKCQEIVDKIGWTDTVLAQIYQHLTNLQAENAFTVDKLNDALDATAQSVLAGIRTKELPQGDEEKFVDDCLRQLQREFLEQEYEKHRLLADEYERLADERFLHELMETQRIKDEIKKLYGK